MPIYQPIHATRQSIPQTPFKAPHKCSSNNMCKVFHTHLFNDLSSAPHKCLSNNLYGYSSNICLAYCVNHCSTTHSKYTSNTCPIYATNQYPSYASNIIPTMYMDYASSVFLSNWSNFQSTTQIPIGKPSVGTIQTP